MNTALANRWNSLWVRLGAKGDGKVVWQALADRYNERHRRYHNLDHVAHCLSEFDLAHHLSQKPDAIEVAIFFHDAIYDPRAKDNEQRSADMACEVLSAAGLDHEFTGRIAILTLDTKHMGAVTTSDGQLLVDVDLAILGQARERFAEYERQIRAEYAWVPEADFKSGRAAILQRFLDRPAIYGTEFFRSRYEETARSNLRWSADRLMRP
jgi:predicted metal-dependent HD superfamily phosphohydrolase